MPHWLAGRNIRPEHLDRAFNFVRFAHEEVTMHIFPERCLALQDSGIPAPPAESVVELLNEWWVQSAIYVFDPSVGRRQPYVMEEGTATLRELPNQSGLT